MVKYEYNADLEAFKRIDNRGKPLFINVAEAQRVASLLNLGHSVNTIEQKVKLANPKSGVTTIKSFIKNYKAGNIEIPTDAPAPVLLFNDLGDSRIDDLERRIGELEQIINSIDSIENNLSFKDKVKLWIKS